MAASIRSALAERHGWLDPPRDQGGVCRAGRARALPRARSAGAVRNALIGPSPSSDVDIATPARPEQVMQAAAQPRASRRCRPASRTARSRSLPTIVPYEVTTLREDVETHGRHATVAFTDDWAADARRRDFTINALYCSADGEVFDPLGGLSPDLRSAARALHRRARGAHPRGLSAHPALLPHHGRLRRGCARRRRPCRLRARAGGPWRSSRRSARTEMPARLAAPRGPEARQPCWDFDCSQRAGRRTARRRCRPARCRPRPLSASSRIAAPAPGRAGGRRCRRMPSGWALAAAVERGDVPAAAAVSRGERLTSPPAYPSARPGRISTRLGRRPIAIAC